MKEYLENISDDDYSLLRNLIKKIGFIKKMSNIAYIVKITSRVELETPSSRREQFPRSNFCIEYLNQKSYSENFGADLLNDKEAQEKIKKAQIDICAFIRKKGLIFDGNSYQKTKNPK